MSLFASFWQAGFESATHRNSHGVRVDMVAATQHVEYADEDYARLRQMGIRVAREGIRWHLVEQDNRRFDFSSIVPIMDAAKRHGVQVVWSLCHYGWPDDLDIFAQEFVSRFAAYLGRQPSSLPSTRPASPSSCRSPRFPFSPMRPATLARFTRMRTVGATRSRCNW